MTNKFKKTIKSVGNISTNANLEKIVQGSNGQYMCEGENALMHPVRSPYTLPEYEDAIWTAVTQNRFQFQIDNEVDDLAAGTVAEELPEYFSDVMSLDDSVTAQQIIARLRAIKRDTQKRRRRAQSVGKDTRHSDFDAEQFVGPERP